MALPPEACEEFERILPYMVALVLDFSYDKLNAEATPHVGEATYIWFMKYDREYFLERVRVRGGTVSDDFNIGMCGVDAVKARLDRMMFLTNRGDYATSEEQSGA